MAQVARAFNPGDDYRIRADQSWRKGISHLDVQLCQTKKIAIMAKRFAIPQFVIFVGVSFILSSETRFAGGCSY